MLSKKKFKKLISEKIIYNKDILIYFLLAFSVLFNFIMIFHHENWRDEAQAWLIAKELNPIELFDVLSYEGHPCLWFLLLMSFAKLGFPYITINIISFILVSAAAVIFVRYAPFNKITVAVIIISPMFVYFCAVFGRSYSLAAFLITLLAWQYKKRYEHPFMYFAVLALLIQTHILIIGMAFAVCAVHFFEVLIYALKKKKSSESKNTSFNINIPKNFLALIIPLCSALFLLYEFRDVTNAQSTMIDDKAFSIINFLKGIRSFFMMFFFADRLLTWFVLIILAVFLFMSVRILKSVRTAKYIFIGGMLFIVPVYINVYVYSVKQYHVVMILFTIFFLIWIMQEELDSVKAYAQIEENQHKEIAYADICSVLINAFSVIFLFCVMISYYGGIISDYRGSYSDSKNTAAFVETLPENSVIFESAEDSCNAVVAYLRKNKIINPFTDTGHLYCERNKNKISVLDYKQFLENVKKQFPDTEYIYLLYGKGVHGSFSHMENVPDNLEIVYETQDKNTENEQFIVYKIFLPERLKIK